MGAVYLASLIIGLGIQGIQLLLSGDHAQDLDAQDLDAHELGPGSFGGGDLDADVGGAELTLHADADADPGVSVQGSDLQGAEEHAPADHDLGVLTIFLSFRFWTFALTGFGLLGCFLHYLDLAKPTLTLVSSLGMGLGSGALAGWTFRALGRTNVTSSGDSLELVGQIGKVLLPPNEQGRSKIRLQLRGQTRDYVATADEEQLRIGESVMVEEVRGTELHVSPAPAGLKYSEEE